MNYNSNLQANNAELQELIDIANALPDASDVELPELTNPAIASDALADKEFIDQDGNKVTGTIATKTSSDLTTSGSNVIVPAGYYAENATKSVATATQATPSVSIDANGKITATATQTAGYVSAGTKSDTKQLTTQAAKTITPSKSSQTAVAKDVYTTGAVTVAAIPSQYITTTDATAVAGEIFNGETAYVNGSKVTGTFTIDEELTDIDELLTNLETALQGKSSGGGSEGIQTAFVEVDTTYGTELTYVSPSGITTITNELGVKEFVVPSICFAYNNELMIGPSVSGNCIFLRQGIDYMVIQVTGEGTLDLVGGRVPSGGGV